MVDRDGRRDREPSPRSLDLGVSSKAMLPVSAVLVAGVESLSPLDMESLVVLSMPESVEPERVRMGWEENFLFPKFCKNESMVRTEVKAHAGQGGIVSCDVEVSRPYVAINECISFA